ncbi:C-type lectin domain family 4 member G isoform X1 [Camelus ferus]|uniref:C-type lectin domain family 4 member G isoform X1 n=1 Tax=Camelus ferus TaxID=419612 RepID=A0A8B6Y909_CAMFR|nr:C-type lectin domain family 4 member G isoform X1 [Camelus ferus]
MDTAGYSKWDGRLQEVPGGHWGRWGQRPLFLALTLVVVTVLWVLILSILFSKASTERGALLGHQDLLRTNASKQTAVLGALKEDVRACNSCCLGTQAQLQTLRTQLGEAQTKVIQQESALKELSERVAQGLAEAGRDRENIRTELFRTLEGIRLGNSSCKKCPKSWLPFQGSCYLFSPLRATWVEAQHNCEGAGAHLVIVGGLDEQGFLSRNTQGRGYWLGLRAVRRARKIQGYQWADGVSLSFSYWNRGEPNDSLGREDCVMMLRTGMWNDAPCDSKDDSWICEKRHQC